MTRWYRAYEGTVTDPKLAEAAMAAGCSRSVAIAAWHLILENAAAINDGGRIDIPPRRIAAALCEPLAVIEALAEAFAATGIVVGSRVTAWNRRQYTSDNSTARSQKHRAKMAEKLPHATDATLHGRCATAPYTETETEVSDANASGAAAPLSASQMTKAIFDTGIALLAPVCPDQRQARSIIGRWRKQYTDSQVLAVIARCERAEDVSNANEWITKALQREARNERQPTTGIAGALDRRLGLGEPAREAGRRAIGDGRADLQGTAALPAPMQ